MSIYLLDTFKFPIIAEVSFACSTTEYEWVVPAGVTRISAVCIGGGGGGRAGSGQREGPGGGGGGLRWVNNLVVSPGETLRIQSGVGGTGCPTVEVLLRGSGLIAWGRPGQDSYIASDFNTSIPERSSIPDQTTASDGRVIGNGIIFYAEGGGWNNYVTDQIRINPSNPSNTVDERNTVTPQLNNNIRIVGTRGGQGTSFGTYSWGIVGGGNGGNGGLPGGIGGGQDSGAGGAGGWFGNGGNGGTATQQNNPTGGVPTSGSGGGGGGSPHGPGGGASATGGGGGTGVFWGNGPNGIRGGYYWDGSTGQFTLSNSSSELMLCAGGQGGSFGADGRATGSELIQDTLYVQYTNNNYTNQSNGNGLRGWRSNPDDIDNVNFVKPNGGLYGGGGGAAQAQGSLGQATPIAGDGGCGHVRILFVARNDFIIREFGPPVGGPPRTTETRTIKGENVTVNIRDWNPNLTISQNLSNGWPAWDPVPSTGVVYNLLVNYASNLPGENRGFLPAAIGIGTNPNNYPI